ncbi:serine proteinase stubble-like [Diabrotica virgifera virgifera]|uniref:Peptidase S1 domain-containing protein n=1 Tax=Diabrotica virgifera virgifera TaxID=50390 RepID=A0ABM5IWJ1_DIAVI|nr:serine proteinase stubble-like [Diabrotica virgifera virgifera]
MASVWTKYNRNLVVLVACFYGIHGFQTRIRRIMTPQGGGSDSIPNPQVWPVPFYSNNGLIITQPSVQPVQTAEPVQPVVTPATPIVTQTSPQPPATIGTVNNINISPAPIVANFKAPNTPNQLPPIHETPIINPDWMINYAVNPPLTVPPVTSATAATSAAPDVFIIDPQYMITPAPYIPPPVVSTVETNSPVSTSTSLSTTESVQTSTPLPSSTSSITTVSPTVASTLAVTNMTSTSTVTTTSPASVTSTTTTTLDTKMSSTVLLNTTVTTQTPFTSVLLNSTRNSRNSTTLSLTDTPFTSAIVTPRPRPEPIISTESTLNGISTATPCENPSTLRPLGLDCNYTFKPPQLANQVLVVNPSGTASIFQVELPAVIKFDLNITSMPNYIVSVSPATDVGSDVIEIVSATSASLVSSTDTFASSLNTINIDLSDPNLNTGWSSTLSPFITSPVVPQPLNRISQEKCIEYSSSRRSARKSQVTVFIIGGQSSKQKEFPHMAALGYGVKSENQWLCGGSLISENYVLTAAHCLTAPSLGAVQYVRLGTTTLQTETLDSADYNVVRRIPYPTYVNGRQYDDIALLQLDRPVQFTEYIQPICLFASTDLSNVQLTATGWGKTSNYGSIAKDLQKVDLDYVPNDVCQKAYSIIPKDELPYGIIDTSQLCGGTQDGSKDTCQGDSGGPLQVQQDGRLYIVGITSFGIGCGKPGIPGVYTRVSNYLPWIEQTVWGR